MKTRLIGIAALAAVLGFAAAGHAQATRTWVSGVGDDANPCSRTAPCKTWAGAIAKTTTGGEIDALDPAGYGAVTITKSITLDGGGNLASVLVSGTNGIVIQALPTDVVTLRRLSINGIGTGLIGVRILQAAHVNLEDVKIFGFDGAPGNAVSVEGVTKVQIANCTFENNANAGVFTSAGSTSIVSSALVGNGYAGLDATSTSQVLVSNSNLSMNGRGIHTIGSATVRMTHLDIFFNTAFAWQIEGGQIQTHVDNRVLGATSGTLTKVSY
jgi:hypothetical protein